MTGNALQLHTAVVRASCEHCALIGELLSALPLPPATEIPVNGDEGTVTVFCPTREEAQRIAALMRDIFASAEDALPPGSYEISCGTIDEHVWSEWWRHHFGVERVGRRFVVRPQGEPYTAKPGDVVLEINPRRAFGTGHHETTQACLMLLEDCIDKATNTLSLLDAGCGSGILAIAAAKLGLGPINAFDNWPDAVEAARENCAMNGVEAHVRLFCADLDSFTPDGRYDVVTANIQTVVLCRNAARLAASVKPGGRLIAAGMLVSQFPEVRAAFAAHNLVLMHAVTIEEWQSGIFTTMASA